MVPEEDEKRWIVESQKGDHSAFEELIKKYQRMIHSLAYRMTGSMADAQDLAQEAFIQAYQKLDQFRGDASFSSWLYRIALNIGLNWKKREKRRYEIHEDFAKEETSSDIHDDSRAEQVRAALMKLHPKQRAAIVLTVYEEMNHAEAAKVLGCSETTVSWRIFAARAKLKRLLKGARLKGEA